MLTAGSSDTSSSTISFRTAAGCAEAERMRIDSSGNVGIGTSSPTGTLSIDSTGGTSQSIITTSTDGTSYVNLEVGGINATPSLKREITFHTNAAAASRTERMRIDSSGNVGIGLTPSSGGAVLQISGGLRIAGSASASDTTAPYIFRTSGVNNMVLATDGTERMRIKSDGKVGIGVTGPDDTLTIGSETLGYGSALSNRTLGIRGGVLGGVGGDSLNLAYFGYESTNNNTAGLNLKAFRTATGNDWTTTALKFTFNVDNTDPVYDNMLVFNAGKIGIGTSSPSKQLVISSSGANGIEFNPDDVTTSTNRILSYNRSTSAFTPLSIGADDIRFYFEDAEKMRIDSSGNLLVGKTSASGVVAGGEIRSDGIGIFSRTNDYPLQLRRLGTSSETEGDLVRLYRASSQVGTIGTVVGDGSTFYVGTSTGIGFGAISAFPMDGDLDLGADGTKDLGYNAGRWRNLYLSGGVYLGGTGSSNYMDDYEEGTFTITLPNGGGISSANGTYTKIGNLVTATMYATSINPTANTSQFQLGGLPFTAKNTLNLYVGGSLGYTGQNNLNDMMPITGQNLNYVYFHENDGEPASVTNNTMRARGLTGDSADAIIVTINYFTA